MKGKKRQTDEAQQEQREQINRMEQEGARLRHQARELQVAQVLQIVQTQQQPGSSHDQTAAALTANWSAEQWVQLIEQHRGPAHVLGNGVQSFGPTSCASGGT